MAKNNFLDWDTTASNNSDVGGIGILGTNAVSNFDDALRTIMAQLKAGVDGKVAYVAKSANYTAVANDNNGYMRFTAAATLSLTAVATLGANWHLFVQADGGDVTVDPNASETINGATTIVIRNGESALIVSSGTAFFARVNPAAAVYAAKSGNYTALPSDNGAIHRYTAAATLSLTAAATLGSSWRYTVIADGGAVIIDPNASETINGQLTLTVPSGATATIICDGSNFFLVLKPAVWEAISDRALSAVASMDVTDLGAFRKLRITGFVYPSVAATIIMRTSTNNGVSYDAGASDYTYQYLGSQGAASSAGQGATTSFPLTNLANVNATVNEGLEFSIQIENFNKASQAKILSNGAGFNGGGDFNNITNGRRNSTTARNALQLLSSSGTITGNVTIEGLRG